MFALALLISLGVRALDGPVKHGNSQLHNVTGWIGTAVSGGFLYLIAALNLVILVGHLPGVPADAPRHATTRPSSSTSSTAAAS